MSIAKITTQKFESRQGRYVSLSRCDTQNQISEVLKTSEISAFSIGINSRNFLYIEYLVSTTSGAFSCRPYGTFFFFNLRCYKYSVPNGTLLFTG